MWPQKSEIIFSFLFPLPPPPHQYLQAFLVEKSHRTFRTILMILYGHLTKQGDSQLQGFLKGKLAYKEPKKGFSCFMSWFLKRQIQIIVQERVWTNLAQKSLNSSSIIAFKVCWSNRIYTFVHTHTRWSVTQQHWEQFRYRYSSGPLRLDILEPQISHPRVTAQLSHYHTSLI